MSLYGFYRKRRAGRSDSSFLFSFSSCYRIAPSFSRHPIPRSRCFSSFVISPMLLPPFLLSLKQSSRPFWHFSPPTPRLNHRMLMPQRPSLFCVSRDRQYRLCSPCSVSLVSLLESRPIAINRYRTSSPECGAELSGGLLQRCHAARRCAKLLVYRPAAEGAPLPRFVCAKSAAYERPAVCVFADDRVRE